MDSILLDEILRSLRLIRDEISLLREKDGAKKVRIDTLEADVKELEIKLQPLVNQFSKIEGAKSTAAVISSFIGGLLGFLVALLAVGVSVYKGG